MRIRGEKGWHVWANSSSSPTRFAHVLSFFYFCLVSRFFHSEGAAGASEESLKYFRWIHVFAKKSREPALLLLPSLPLSKNTLRTRFCLEKLLPKWVFKGSGNSRLYAKQSIYELPSIRGIFHLDSWCILTFQTIAASSRQKSKSTSRVYCFSSVFVPKLSFCECIV